MQVEFAIALDEIDAEFEREILLHVADGQAYTS
jgi:hypothetical protein